MKWHCVYTNNIVYVQYTLLISIISIQSGKCGYYYRAYYYNHVLNSTIIPLTLITITQSLSLAWRCLFSINIPPFRYIPEPFENKPIGSFSHMYTAMKVTCSLRSSLDIWVLWIDDTCIGIYQSYCAISH